MRPPWRCDGRICRWVAHNLCHSCHVHLRAVLRHLPLTSLHSISVQNPEVTSRIRKIFNSQEGLTGLVKTLPLDQRFQLPNVKSVSSSDPLTSLHHHICHRCGRRCLHGFA